MHELPLEHVLAGVVEPDTFVPGGDEEVVAVVGEAEVGDAIGRGVRQLPPAPGGNSSGSAHAGFGRRKLGFRRSMEIGASSIYGN